MADSASTLEAQQRRTLNADTFAQLQARQVNPDTYIQRQAAGLESSLEGLNSRIPGMDIASQNAGQAQTIGAQQGQGPMARLQQLQQLRHSMQARRAAGKDAVVTALNITYAREVAIVQSELIANVLALEVFVSPWLFLLTYFLRVVGGNLLHIRIKGFEIWPPYKMGMVMIGHTCAVFVILTILFLIFFLITIIVWIIVEGPWRATQVFIDLVGGPFSALKALLSGS